MVWVRQYSVAIWANSVATFFANVTPFFTPLFTELTPVRNIAYFIAASKSAKTRLDSIVLGIFWEFYISRSTIFNALGCLVSSLELW